MSELDEIAAQDQEQWDKSQDPKPASESEWPTDDDRLAAFGRHHEAEVSGLRAALAPFAAFADPQHLIPDYLVITQGSMMGKRQLTMGDCYRALDALHPKEVTNG